MAVTVGWLARQAGLGLRMVAGAERADREISWAHAIELADPAPYLSGGELVMTTGINVGTGASAQFDYLSRLAAADAAALAFDTGISFHHVPPGIIAAGDALGIPVLQVPASTPFIAITRTVIDRINAEQLKSVQHTVDEQERLARETLRGGIPAVVVALARALEATVVAMSPSGRPLAAAGADRQRVAGLGAELAAATSRGRRGASSRVVADGGGYCTVQVLRAASNTRGYLVVRSERALTAAERLLIAHSVSLISIELEKPVGLIDAEQRLRVAVAQGLIETPGVRAPSLLRYFGFDPDGAVVALAVRGCGPSLDAQVHLHRILHRRGLAFLMCPHEDGIVVVLPAAEAASVTALHRSLTRQFGRDLVTGVSPSGSFAELAIAVSQAWTASRSRDRQSLRQFDKLGLIGVLLGDRTPQELTVLAGVVTPLDGENLLPTLAAFLERNGHIEGAAAALGVHRHTMRNRLARIGELLDMSLESADTRAILLIALHARELLAPGAGP